MDAEEKRIALALLEGLCVLVEGGGAALLRALGDGEMTRHNPHSMTDRTKSRHSVSILRALTVYNLMSMRCCVQRVWAGCCGCCGVARRTSSFVSASATY